MGDAWTTQKYLNWLTPYAIESQRETGVPASLILSQALLEGWSSRYQRPSELVQKANNLFGVKADSSWGGETYLVYTWEDNDGDGVEDPDERIKQNFRKYSGLTESFTDHANVLEKWKVSGKNVWDSITAITTGKQKYATDAKYADKLKSIITKYDLTKYDKIQGKPSDPPKDDGGVITGDNESGESELNFLTQMTRVWVLFIILIFTLISVLKMFDIVPVLPQAKIVKGLAKGVIKK